MANFLSFQTNSRLLPPEIIWLEPEQVEQAKTMSQLRLGERSTPELQQWQNYLNALALLSFEQWLSERLPEYPIERSPNFIGPVFYVEVNGFRFCLIAIEHVLDEIMQIPQALIEQPALAAHFYVLLEVSEEQELVIVRGFLRFDELISYRDRHTCQPRDSCYPLPLTLMDAEPNHLLFYCRSVQPTAIALESSVSQKSFTLPINAATPVAERFLIGLTHTTTKLTQWLQDAVDPNWQTIDQLIDPKAYLSLSTRSLESVARRGKLINLGVQVAQQSVALLVNVTSEAEEKLGVLVQLHPTGEARFLIPDLKLSLRLSTGKLLQEVTSRDQDNYIQLKPFKGKPGQRFKVSIHLNRETVEENFEL